MNSDLDPIVRFYENSAADYDAACAVRNEPAHAADLAVLRARVAELARGQAVLELACGTGYWTGALAQTAASVLATDAVDAMLEQARARGLPASVSFRRVDGLHLPDDLGKASVVFAGFWWSHLTRDAQDAFLAGLRGRVGKDALLVLVDDAWVDGVSTPVARTDAQGNTYQILTAPDGTRVELPKNYPSDSALRKRLAGSARDIRIERLAHYWMATARLK
jgi:SAM-dependent methyltransferase